MRPLRASIAALLAVALTLVLPSCGGNGGETTSADLGPAGVAPPGAPIYLEATLRPEGEQKANAEALLAELGSVPLLGSQIEPSDLGDQAVQAFDSAVGADVDYASDVEPWLGSRAGLAITSFTQAPDALEGAGTPTNASYVLAVETTDEQLAKDSLAERRGWRDRILAALVLAKRQVMREKPSS